jgi:hypothetical protein
VGEGSLLLANFTTPPRLILDTGTAVAATAAGAVVATAVGLVATGGAVVAAGALGLVGAAVGVGAAQASKKHNTTNTVIAKLTVRRIFPSSYYSQPCEMTS